MIKELGEDGFKQMKQGKSTSCLYPIICPFLSATSLLLKISLVQLKYVTREHHLSVSKISKEFLRYESPRPNKGH